MMGNLAISRMRAGSGAEYFYQNQSNGYNEVLKISTGFIQNSKDWLVTVA
jgi:hypothetical protein